MDVDTGTDDAVALMLAVLHPDLELVAATCVGGNTPVENVVENTLRVFDWLGETRVPVYAAHHSSRLPFICPYRRIHVRPCGAGSSVVAKR